MLFGTRRFPPVMPEATTDTFVGEMLRTRSARDLNSDGWPAWELVKFQVCRQALDGPLPEKEIERRAKAVFDRRDR